MNDNWRQVIVAALTNAPAILTAICAIIIAVFSGIAAWQTKQTHRLVNQMRDQEKAETKEASDTTLKAEIGRAHAEGMIEGSKRISP